jgi:peptidoglycan/LPS O-acetylase OafA/YrhL
MGGYRERVKARKRVLRRPSLAKAIAVVLVAFAIVMVVFVVSGLLFTLGLFLLPVLALVGATYVVWSARRRPPPPPE